ncbi:serine hydrolase [Flavisolibacter sp. BT320]|nr:serine hydrolase [Flavisolibacter longurius]
MVRYAVFILFLLFSKMSVTQPKTDNTLLSILATNQNSLFQQVLKDPQTHRLQIIYTQIDRDKQNKPSFTNYFFHYDPELYFNPASMVKMPLAFLALEKLNRINRKDITKHTTIQFDSSQPWQKTLYTDTSANNGKPTLAHLIKRAFLVSENDPYNRLYQFVGQGETNRSLHQKGYTDVRITRQFMGLTQDQNRYTNAVRFLDEAGNVLYTQPASYNSDSFDFSRVIKLGKAHWDRNDNLVNEPFDFTPHNSLSLLSMQQMLQSVMFPQSVPAKQRFGLTDDDYRFLWQYLSQYPSETPDPKYDTTEFYDSYVKFFFRDSTRKMPEGVRVFNKVGWAYGFLTDVSYVADFKNGVEYMLSATVYVNSDEVLNDGKYEYTTVGWPFLYQLGQTVYRHELNQKRSFRPDLSAFRIIYEKRDPADTRPSLKNVDN